MPSDLSDWTVVFDLDGTLVETAPDLHAALNHTLAQKNLAPVPLDSIRDDDWGRRKSDDPQGTLLS